MKSHASMNRIYRLVWNAALNLWVAVAENAKGQGKSGSARNKAALLMLVPLAALMHQARAADAANAAVVSGAGTVATSGQTTTINQATQKLAIDWTSLSTRANEALVFNQPNAQAIALNRITGSNPSELLGSLTANGQVFILNPNGVLFGAGSQVNVGGLVASTLNMSNADFEAGNYKFTGPGGGSVVNQGTLNAGQGGYLALLAPEVRNEGVMTASLGTALLAAGNKVTLNLDNGSLLGYSIDQGAINALAENKQLIKADGGQVLLSAKAMNSLTTATVNNTGVIEARTLQNKAGRILLMGDMETGTVNVGGTLDASAPTAGNGGFIETSAANVKVAAGTRVTTKAANGNSGTWLIDPVDFTIAAGSAAQDVSGMGADTLSANLDGGNVSIATSATTAGNGDIFVNSAVSWSAANTLTLSAHRDIQINSAVTAAAGGLTLNAGNVISAPAAVNVGTFTLASGTWSQVGGNLPVFSARDFRINGGTFIRAAGGDGASTATAYQLTDVYGLQGAGSAGMLGKHYALANNVDASGTGAWNTNAGFNPLGDGTSNFTGTFDGMGHTITGLTIDRAATSNTGLFGATEASASISNVGLVGGSVKGKSNVGALVGRNQGSISDSYASTNVTGSAAGDSVGGLVGLNGDGDIGGPAGAGNGGTISNSHASGIVTGRDYVGGLIGQSNSGAVTNSHATGRVTGRNYSGGLIGYNSNGIRSGGSDVSNSYATGNVTGTYSVGGLMGASEVGAITNSYATGTVVGSDQNVGGLIGSLQNADPSRGIVSNSYSTGNVTGLLLVGGLVGVNFGTIRNSYSTGSVSGGSNTGGLVGSSSQGSVINSFWNKETSGQTSSAGSASSAGKTSAEMMMASTFTGAGWSASNVGGDGTTWRIYEGQTGPLLRGFLTQLVIQPKYDGSGAALSSAGELAMPAGTDMAKISGSATDGTLTLASNGLAGSYTATASTAGLYSGQQGYDISNEAIRAISTPGSAVGDVKLGNDISFTDGALVMSAAGNIDLNGKAISASNGYLLINGGTAINAGAVNVDTFLMFDGMWSQSAGTLAAFSARDFGILGGAFIRALGGDGASAATAYQITDVYGLQGAGSAGMLGKHYALANNIDASGTAAWDNSAGFKPIGDGSSSFTGTFDGLGHTITGLGIDRATSDHVGLFGATGTSASIRDVGLVGGSVKGNSYVGALAGRNQGSISGSYASTDVTGSAGGNSTGGLVGVNGDGNGDGNSGPGTGYADGSNGGAISNSYASGIVTGNNFVGGLIGQSNSGAITGSHATGNVFATGYDTGGLIGYSGNGSSTGGSDVSNSYATGNVTGGDTVGGLIGTSEVGAITNSYATGTVAGSASYVGGLVGLVITSDPSLGVISNSYSTGSVSGDSKVGGLVGYNHGTIINSYSIGNVTGSNGNAGGLVGVNQGTVSNAYSTGSVNGRDYTGGLVGYASSGSISNSYSTGSVNNGVAGSYVGGLVGRNYLGSVANSFWNTETSGQESSDGGTGKTTVEMMQASTFTGAGWSASNVGGDGSTWRIYEGHTGPLLRSFLTARTLADTALTYNGTTQVTTAADVLGSVSGRNAGTYSNSGFYSAQDGYDLSGGDLTINKADLVLAAVTDSKTYDGSTASTMAVDTAGLFSGDNVTAAQSFGSKNVLGANGSTLAVDAGYTVADGNGGGNYNVTVTAAAGTIHKATLSVTGVVADNKTYDGTDAATLGNIGTLNGLVGGETLVLSQTAASFDNKNAGTAKVVTASGYGLADGTGGTAGLASNYQLASTTATASANIDKAALTVTANTVTRAYDGSTAATGAGTVGTLAGAGAGERVNAAGSQAYADKNAGTGKTVTASGVTIKDAANLDVTGNYDITYVADNTSVINKATLTVTGVVADDRTYNGTDAATLSNIGTLSGLVGGETLALSQAAAAFNDKNAGTGKAVTATGYAIADGSGGTAGLASNYQLASTTATTSANIAQANLSITTTDATKTYDGGTVAAGTVQTTGTVYGGDSVSGGSFAFSNKNAGTGDKVVNVSGVMVGDGTNNANYNITYVANTTSTIHKADLTVQASGVDKVYDGTTTATVALSDNGFVGDVLNLSANASFADKNAGLDKTVSVSGIAVTGADAGNYNLVGGTSASTQASITPRALTVTAADDAKNYDNVAYSGGAGVSYSGFVAGDSLADIGGSLAYGGSSQGAIAAGNYLITPGGLRSISGNYTLGFGSGALSIAALNASSASLGGTALVGAYDGAMQAVAGLGGSSVGGGGGGFGGSADAMAGALATAAAEAGNTEEK